MKEIMANQKDINDEIFWDYFKYQIPLVLAKDFSKRAMKAKKLVSSKWYDELIDLRNYINRNEIPENENQKKVVKIHEKS